MPQDRNAHKGRNATPKSGLLPARIKCPPFGRNAAPPQNPGFSAPATVTPPFLSQGIVGGISFQTQTWDDMPPGISVRGYSRTSLFQTRLIQVKIKISQADSPSIDRHLVLTRLFETPPFRTYFHVPWDFEIAGWSTAFYPRTPAIKDSATHSPTLALTHSLLTQLIHSIHQSITESINP